MMTLLDTFGATIGGSPATRFAVDLALKATALLAMAFGCHAMLGRRRALARSSLWNATLVGLLLLPAIRLTSPRIVVASLPSIAPVAPVTSSRAIEADSNPIVPEPDVASPGPDDRRVSGGIPADPVPRPTLEPRAGRPVESPRWRVDGPAVAFGLYLTIALLLAARFVASLLAVRRLRDRCRSVEEQAWTDRLDHWRDSLRIGRRVPLLATGRISIPVVVGWPRPAILLPERLVGEANPGLIDAILVHELGHVRRGDFGWNLIRAVVRIVYWPHPLAWLAGRAIGSVREQACDDLCVHWLGGPAPYRESLLEVASGMIRRPGPSLGLAMARGSNLGRRLAWIEQTRGVSRCLQRWPARMAAVIAIASTAGLLGASELGRAKAKAVDPQEPAAKQAAAKIQPGPAVEAAATPTAIEIMVRAKDTGLPLAGASIRFSIDHENATSKADVEGRLRIDLSKRRFKETFNFDVWAEGYVQQRYFFSEYDVRHPKLPSQVAVELNPGEQTLGGRVVDEQGQPVRGVKVEIWGYLGSMKREEELVFMVDATTDDQGQWRCRSFREMKFAYLYLSHPDYLADDSFHPRPHGQPTPSSQTKPDDKPMEALRDFSDVQVLSRGVLVAGEVVDEQGKPVEGAEVGWLEATARDTFHHILPTTSTDPQGRFRFPHARPGKLAIQVQAKGHAPALVSAEGPTGPEPEAIKLGPGRPLEGRVVDSQGKPIPEVSVNVDTWRGYRALGVFLKTDAGGRFRWDDAPPDLLLLGAYRSGFEAIFQRRVDPEEGEVSMTLKRSLSVSGSIRDAETGRRIDQAQVEVGSLDPETGEIRWGRNNRSSVRQGELQASIETEQAAEFRLRIHARGYQPAESRAIRSEEGNVNVDFRLAKLEGVAGVVAGVVLRPDGRPLEGAEVAVTYPMAGRERLPTVQIINGKFATGRELATAKTDAQGRFSIVRELDPAGRFFGLVVIHPDFYAEVSRASIEADPTIRALPWGRVEGVVRLGDQVAAGSEVHSFADRMGFADVPSVHAEDTAKADDRGHYVLEHVVPGDLRVAPGSIGGPRFKAWSNGTLVEVRAGETTRADVGGKGRNVIARIALPEGFDPKGDYAANSEFEIESDRPMVPYPAGLFARRDASASDWGKNWWASAEGHAYRKAWVRLGQAKLKLDGTILARDVPPGEYRLRLTYGAEPIRGRAGSTGRIAFATKQFIIPEGGGDGPFDLGLLHPRPRQLLKVGQPAPKFDVETLGAGRIKLDDFRGKYVLVDFWASWCGPCVAEVPGLKEIHDRFGKDKRFAMLGLSLDPRKDEPRQFVEEKGIAWPQGFLGESAEGGVPEAYHVESIPSLFLIGPDGTIKAQGLRGTAIAAAIVKALDEP